MRGMSSEGQADFVISLFFPVGIWSYYVAYKG